MRILVTGGAGFIGSNFVRYWLTRHPGDRVAVLDLLTYAGREENLADIRSRIEFFRGDICDPEAVREALAGSDAVVHFAAESHVDRSISGPDAFVRTNVLGTHELLKAARELKVSRFHHVSTDEVFGHLPAGSTERWTEESPYRPRSPYAATKAASDHLVSAYHSTYGLPVTISNCTNNYGPYHFPEKLIPLAITNALEGKKVPLYGQGQHVREWLYVEDHCRGIEAILERGTVGQTYLLGPSEPHRTNREIVRMVLGLLGCGEELVEFVADRPGHDEQYALDCSKAERELGWRAEVGLGDGLKATVGWYLEHRGWWEPIKSGEYRRYYERQYTNRV